jgi:hypothetical protein
MSIQFGDAKNTSDGRQAFMRPGGRSRLQREANGHLGGVKVLCREGALDVVRAVYDFTVGALERLCGQQAEADAGAVLAVPPQHAAMLQPGLRHTSPGFKLRVPRLQKAWSRHPGSRVRRPPWSRPPGARPRRPPCRTTSSWTTSSWSCRTRTTKSP